MKGKARGLLHKSRAIDCVELARNLLDLRIVDKEIDAGLDKLISGLCFFAAEICENEHEEIAVYIIEGRSFTARELLYEAGNALDPDKIRDNFDRSPETSVRIALKILETN